MSNEEDEAAAVLVTIFESASLKEISMSNARHGIATVPSSSNVFLRTGMNFSIVLRAASMVSKLFEMVASVMGRGGGRESKGEIGFTVVMLHGTPHLAVDVWDDSQTIVVSVRVSTDVYLHPEFTGHGGQFPIFRVTCKSMVEKLSHAKDFHRVMIYQQSKATNQLEILIDTPDKAGNVQHETVLIKSDQWESLRLEDVTHNYTLQLAIKNITQLCKMQHDSTGKLTLTIYDIGCSTVEVPSSRSLAGVMTAATTTTTAADACAATGVTRQRQNFILKLEVSNALDETSSTLRPVTTEIEKSVDPVTGEEQTTMHFVESQHRPALDLMEAIGDDAKAKVTFRQSFVSGYIESFLSKFDPNKVVTLRLAEDNPMVISYSHGSLVLCQMVAAPFVE